MSRAASTVVPVLDGPSLRRWLDAGRGALEAAREEIDGLNVFPVPDGDTGTNLLLTVTAAVEAAGEVEGDDAGTVLRAAVRGATLGARGNSGVILSALLRGLAEGSDPAGLDGPGLTRGLGRAVVLGYDAVGLPVEGTILSVAKAAAQAAGGQRDDDLATVAVASADGAREALLRTTGQLEQLARAGVVDAGGAGLTVLLDALAEHVTGTARPPRPSGRSAPVRPAPGTPAPESHPGPAFEVMYLLDAADAAVPGLRTTLGGLGDSLVVVGGEGTWNVHVHVDDAGAAVEAGMAAGRPYRIRITHLAPVGTLPGGRAVVAVATGPGLERIFEQSGAAPVAAGPGRRATTADLLDAVERAGAGEVLLLPNDAPSRAAADEAAIELRARGHRVAVVPVSTSVQALAAMAVHDPSAPFEDDVIAMTSAGRHARHGGVTVADREAVTSAGHCQAGDVLGVVDGDFVVIGSELGDVARHVIELMLASGGELVTLLVGADGDQGLVRDLEAWLLATRPAVDVAVHEGGQPRYPLLIGVE